MDKTLETQNNQDKLLETDNGRFLIELKRVSNDLEEYISASKVAKVVKNGCREIIDEMKSKVEKASEKKENDENDSAPYTLSGIAVSKLLDLLDIKDAEQHELFKALRDTIYVARDSAIGW